MDQDSSSSGKRANSPDGLVHAVRLNLQRLLAETWAPFSCRYACFIHPRRRQGERGFGVITLGGESLPLTATMLESLKTVPTLLDGRALVVVGPGKDKDTLVPGGDGDWAVPLPVTQISMRLCGHDRKGRPDSDGEKLLTPTLEGPQLAFLCADRPAGWPL